MTTTPSGSRSCAYRLGGLVFLLGLATLAFLVVVGFLCVCGWI